MRPPRETGAVEIRFGRGLRALRIRRGWRQSDVGAAAGLSRSLVSKVEGGDVNGVAVGTLRELAGALGATVDVRLRWHGEGLDRLLDEGHSRLVDAVVARLRASEWDVAVEVSFSIWGERGSIDVLAYHRRTGIVLVVEVKSVVPDSQETLYLLDRKTRLAPQVASDRGWECRAVGRLLVVGDSSTSRRRVARFAAMYDAALPDRGLAVRRWIRHPSGSLAGLVFLPDATPGGTRRRIGGRERVNRPNPARTSRLMSSGADRDEISG